MVHGPCARLHTGLDWNDLRYFLAISRTGTLVGAARELGVEHTTVSRRLAALERALDTRLFIRGPEGLTLTAAGTDLLLPAEEMQRNADAIERLVAGQDQKIEGKVRLTIPEAMNTYALQALTGLRKRHPGLLVEVLSESTREYDRGDKFGHYREISTLREYLLIEQDKVLVEHFQLGPNKIWAPTSHDTLSEVVALSSVNIALPLSEVYQQVFKQP